MSDKKFPVQLTGPAKIGGKWRKAGETVHVTDDEALDLRDCGVVDASADKSVPDQFSGDEFDAAVAAKVDERVAADADMVKATIDYKTDEAQAAADARIVAIEKEAAEKVEAAEKRTAEVVEELDKTLDTLREVEKTATDREAVIAKLTADLEAASKAEVVTTKTKNERRS